VVLARGKAAVVGTVMGAVIGAVKGAVKGAVAFVLLMAAEATLSVLLSGRSLAEHFELYARPAYLLGLAGQIGFAVFPVVRAGRVGRVGRDDLVSAGRPCGR
jgi:hypothetical protein